jgi:hypothetical protein
LTLMEDAKELFKKLQENSMAFATTPCG